MSDVIAEKSGTNEWGILIGQTRLALSTLRADDMEELGARAECMLSATFGHDAIRQRMPRPHENDLIEVTRERRLLEELLVATERNLNVLRRTGGDCRARVGEASSRWER